MARDERWFERRSVGEKRGGSTGMSCSKDIVCGEELHIRGVVGHMHTKGMCMCVCMCV